jgi:hypothetical protein
VSRMTDNWHVQPAAPVTPEPCCHGRPQKKNIASRTPWNGCGQRIGGRTRPIKRELRHGSEISRVGLAFWGWPYVRRNAYRSEFRFDPRGSARQLSARPSIRSYRKQMRRVGRGGSGPKMSAGPGIRRKGEPLCRGRAGGEMSAGPGIRRKHEPLRHGRAWGEMSAGPGIRRKDRPLRLGRSAVRCPHGKELDKWANRRVENRL